MEAAHLKTIDDLAQSADPQVDLINGEIVRWPMARSEHALVQSGISDEVAPFKRKDGRGGWWIMPEISVEYNEYDEIRDPPVSDDPALAGSRLIQ